MIDVKITCNRRLRDVRGRLRSGSNGVFLQVDDPVPRHTVFCFNFDLLQFRRLIYTASRLKYRRPPFRGQNTHHGGTIHIVIPSFGIQHNNTAIQYGTSYLIRF